MSNNNQKLKQSLIQDYPTSYTNLNDNVQYHTLRESIWESLVIINNNKET